MRSLHFPLLTNKNMEQKVFRLSPTRPVLTRYPTKPILPPLIKRTRLLCVESYKLTQNTVLNFNQNQSVISSKRKWHRHYNSKFITCIIQEAQSELKSSKITIDALHEVIVCRHIKIKIWAKKTKTWHLYSFLPPYKIQRIASNMW